MTSNDIKFIEDTKITQALGDGVSWVPVKESAAKGFYFKGIKENSNEHALKTRDILFSQTNTFTELFEYISSKIDVDHTMRFGCVDEQLEVAISFSTTFETRDRTIILGSIDSSIENYYSMIKSEIARTAVYQTSRVSDGVRIFFLTFCKQDLRTIKNTRNKMETYIKMEHMLTSEEKEEILDIAKRFCMSREESKKEDNFFKRLFTK